MEKQNFISTDRKTVKNSFGNYFTIGDIVMHQDTSVGSAKIMFLPIKDMPILIL